MKKFFWVIGVVVLALGAVFVLLQREPHFPPNGVACFDEFKSAVASGYADPSLNVPPFEYKNISHFRCASQKGFLQYEITGVDNAGATFYIHHSAGGVAASGADTYFDFCSIKDGVTIKTDKVVENNPHEVGSCAFEEAFPTNPTSGYTFDRGSTTSR